MYEGHKVFRFLLVFYFFDLPGRIGVFVQVVSAKDDSVFYGHGCGDVNRMVVVYYCREIVAFTIVQGQSSVGSYPQVVPGVFGEHRYLVAGEGVGGILFVEVVFYFVFVETVEPCSCSYPDISFTVVKDGFYGRLAQPFFKGYLFEVEFGLCIEYLD